MAGVFSRVDGKSFDVIVIGSGFGGAVAVTELAKTKNPDGTPKNILVLERAPVLLPLDGLGTR